MTELPAPAPETTVDSQKQFPIVGIGASAGGLAAIEAFFSGMPPDSDPGLAIVLVQHLAPDHDSILTQLVQRCTRMEVVEVHDGMQVQVNCVYVIPPNRDMAFLSGALHLLEPAAPRGHRLPVDFLFRSLAQDQQERAIGIVLSGTGSDGTLGVRAIKGEGGMVMVQTPETTEFDGMPRSALATGLVDFELPAAEMVAQLLAYIANIFGKTLLPSPPVQPKMENALKRIFILLRAQTGHDFSQYKPNTINRRIERRMAVHQVEGVDSYVRYLQQTPVEVEALFRDLLIGVTNFFRDPDAFKLLEEQVIPKLFENKPASSVIRVWVAGCSTGEEAYSIAILLQERMDQLKGGCKVQVFATDIDSRAVAVARAGIYPAGIAGDISPERLAKFFKAEPDGSTYRIQKSIRDMLIFSDHDVNKDPPFSKLDLVSCRNLLIYMGSELQKRLISLFHYALTPGGMLFLGTSETLGDFAHLFTVLDRRAKLFQRKEDPHSDRRAALGRYLANTPSAGTRELDQSPSSGKSATSTKPSLKELTEQTLLQEVVPVAALVNSLGDIQYLHGRTGLFLEPMQGNAGINNILKMAREGLKTELTKALNRAVLAKERVKCVGLSVKTNGHYTQVNLSICPVFPKSDSPGESPYFLVMLEEAASLPLRDTQPTAPASALVAALVGEAGPAQPFNASTADASTANDRAAAQIAELNEQLQAKEEYLHAANEQLETSNEELKSSNEEMQSMNEELQSTNEEMETSKEELQSINEELATVNTELQSKVTDLSRANNDMNNLLAGTGIATVFVDQKLRILRFTPSATQIINLIVTDIGRPIAHIVSNLSGYTNLVNDAKKVLATLMPHETDVQNADGKSFTLRILPYRTLDDVIEGVVITFVDITETVRARDTLQQANALIRLAVVVRDAFDAITVQDLEGRITAWNPGAVRLYGWSEAEALRMNVRDRIPKAQLAKALGRVRELSESVILEPYHTQRLAKDGRLVNVTLTSTALIDEAGDVYAIATNERQGADDAKS